MALLSTFVDYLENPSHNWSIDSIPLVQVVLWRPSLFFFAEHLPTLETTARGSKVRSDKSGKSVISNLTDTKIEHVR